MDPVTALGVASAAMQFVSFTSDFIDGTIKLYNSDDGQEVRNADIANDIQHIEDILQGLRWSPTGNASNARDGKLEAKLAEVTSECHTIYQELNTLLRTTQITESNHGRAIESIRVKWRSTRKKHEIERLYDKLKQLRGHTDSCAIMILSSNGSALTTAIHNLGRDTRSAALTSTWQLAELRRTISNGMESTHEVSKATHTMIDELARETGMRRRLAAFMKSLRFPEMHSRLDAIVEAESYTFEWLFSAERRVSSAHDHGTPVQESPGGGSKNATAGFESWLQSDHSLFWITGVPGCGKSTLMKYIASHKKTAQFLRLWAGPDAKVVVASCYFWSSGSDLQKSHQGLLRTLLAQITTEFPAHVAKACPGRFYDRAETGPAPWTTSELTHILDSVIESTAEEETNIRFCFFVDGLDEYTGDHNAIAKFIKNLSQKPHIKVCISSRELNTFVYHFAPKHSQPNTNANAGARSGQASPLPTRAPVQMLRVHEYTKPDIFRYVRDKLGGDIQPVSFSIDDDQLLDIVAQICTRSQGVFLWVHLICQDIVQGYINDDSWDDLLARVESTPNGLEPYFEKMLRDIDPKYSAETAMILLACLRSNGERVRGKLIDVKVGKVHWEGGTEEVWGALHNAASSCMSVEQIRAACGNIVDVNETNVRFIHRTARDFVADRAEVLGEVLRRHDLDIELYECRSTIYKLGFNSTLDGMYIYYIVRGLLKYEETTGNADSVFLDGLDEYLDDLYVTKCLWKTGDTLRLCLSEGVAIYASTTLARPDVIHVEPVTIMNGVSLPLVSTHLLPWLDRMLSVGESDRPRHTHAVPSQAILWAALGWTDFKTVSTQSVRLSADVPLLKAIQPHGIPASAPIHPDSSIFTSTISQVWLHHLCNGFPNFGTGHTPTSKYADKGFAYMIENADCCDHFFDERTDLSAEPVMRRIQKRRRCKIFLGLFPGPSAIAAHWHCYLRGWLFILYLSVIGKHDFNVEPRALIVKELPFDTRKRKLQQPSPTTPYYHGELLDWGDFLPLELYDFCDIMWPCTWLAMSIGIFAVISAVFMKVLRLLSLVMQLLGMPPSPDSVAEDPTLFRLGLTCCYFVLWALYAKGTVYRRCRIQVRLEYLIAREVSRRRVKKLAVYYFVSFWVLWFLWTPLAGWHSSMPRHSSLPVWFLLPTVCLFVFWYIKM